MRKIRVSTGSASVLDLKKVKTDAKNKTIYLMNSGGCEFDCSFCSQAKSATSLQDKLSRVTWPEYEEDKVLNALGNKESDYKRICMQVVNTAQVFEELPKTVQKLRKSAPNSKLAMTIRTYQMKDIDAMFKAGADEVGLSIDAVDPSQFSKIKGGNFTHYKNFILEAADKYPAKIATHLIVGMGETEKQMTELIEELNQHKIIIALFAFTPVRGAKLENCNPPDISSYRRVQLALHLIRNKHEYKFEYDHQGRLTDFGYTKKALFELIKGSNVFETSGCSDCNRPYYNERSGARELYNHPEKIEEDRQKNVFNSIFKYEDFEPAAPGIRGLPVLN